MSPQRELQDHQVGALQPLDLALDLRVGEPISELATDLWLLTHPDLRRVVRIRAFMAYLAQALDDSGRLDSE